MEQAAKIKDNRITQLEQAAKGKDDRIVKLERAMQTMRQNLDAVSQALSLKPTVAELEAALRGKKR
jgi:hypothetical protein